MEREFVEYVKTVTSFIRDRDYLSLGRHRIARLHAVRRRLGPGRSPTVVGRAIRNLLADLVEQRMRPEGDEDFPRDDWRRYVILRDYIFARQSNHDVRETLAIGEALFFQRKSEAIECLASWLLAEEQEAREERRKQRREQLCQVPNNIPGRIRDYVDRVDEEAQDLVERVVEGLQKRPWVVSIRGFPGVGKTSLAIEAAYAAITELALEQVIWISLRREREVESALLDSCFETIAKELGDRSVLRESDPEHKREVALSLLSDREALLVIDDAEELEEQQYRAVLAFIRDIPAPVPILLVSREMSGVTELETFIALDGMTWDEAEEFLRRAARQLSMQVSEAQARALWKRTSGNCQAMLLALAEMRRSGMTVDEVLEPKHQTMVEILEKLLSRRYESLEEGERQVLHAMALFSDPVEWPTIGAAAGLLTHPGQLRRLLGELHSGFLVNKDDQDRYTILPLTQLFLDGIARLTSSTVGEESVELFRAKASQRLLAYYIEKTKKALFDERLQFVREHRHNILSAMEKCYSLNESRLVTDAVFYLGRCLGELGYWQDRRRWGERAAEAAKIVGDPRRVVWHSIFDVAWAHLHIGELETAEKLTRRGLSEAKALGYREAEAVALRDIGLMELRKGHLGRAEECLVNSLRIAQATDMAEWTPVAQRTLGLTKLKGGQLKEAQDLFEQAYKTHRSMGDSSRAAISLAQLALVASKTGDQEEVDRLVTQASALARTIPKPAAAHAYVLFVSGMVAKEHGQHKDAEECFEKSEQIYSKLGSDINVLLLRAWRSELEASVAPVLD